MDVVDRLYYWTEHVIFFALVALRVWAVVDCVTRKAAAFPATDKLTKPAWLAILVISGLLGSFLGQPNSTYSAVSVFALISTVCAAVYLTDVRPAVREITSG